MPADPGDAGHGGKRRQCEEDHFGPRKVFAETDGQRSLVAAAIAVDVAKVVDDQQHRRERAGGETRQ
jgi:hypothetical protein